MSKKIITKSIDLWLINSNEERITFNIPFSNIYVLELEDISTTVGHNSQGEFMEFLVCKKLNLCLYKSKLSAKEYKQLFDYDILSVTLNLSDNTSKSYNVVWDLNNNRNTLQFIKEEKDILKIFVG